MAKINYQPVEPYQRLFHQSRKPKVYLSAGYGGGKTYALAMKTFQLCSLNYGLPGGLLVPNMKMFRRDVKPTIEEICAQNRIPYVYKSLEAAYYFPSTKSKVYIFHDEDKGYSIKGPNLAFFAINEVTLISEESFKAALARVRLKRARLRQVAMSGTPEGFNWAYDYFISDPRNDTDLYFGDARLNQNVSEDYYAMLADSYDEMMARMYIGGEFINLNGLQALYKFNRHRHTAADVQPDLEANILVSMDFNVSPMAATLWSWNAPKRELRGFDEINISDNADTEKFAIELKRKLREYGIENLDEVAVYPDPAGKARSTKSQFTDIGLLEKGGFTNLKYKTRIKSVRDCLNAANRLLERDNVVLDKKKCKATISDFEQTSLKAGAFELEKKDLKRTHWVDGFKNMCEYEFPIYEVKSQWRNHRAR